MNLFDETENKYYEFLSYLLTKEDSISKEELKAYYTKWMDGEIDFAVMESLFPNKKGEELIFECVENGFVPAYKGAFPIRNNTIETEAVHTLANHRYAKFFLKKSAIAKLNAQYDKKDVFWDEKKICIKNQYEGGLDEKDESYAYCIATIAKAIRNRQAILFDNIKEGEFSYKNLIAFPIKIEYSIVNDQFRIYIYQTKKRKFLKVNLATMKNIKITDIVTELDLFAKFRNFLKKYECSFKLDVEPTDHVIERCFRLFSYYERIARYDKEENKYVLEITYLKFDENEIIRDILSLGASVMVIEPKHLQKKVYERILAARKLYE